MGFAGITFSESFLIFIAAGIIISRFGMWQIYVKANQPGWACLVPFYSLIIYVQVVGKPIWWFLLLIIPYTCAIFQIWCLNRLSKSFGQDTGFTVGLVLLYPIFVCVLGFGNYTYLGPGGEPEQ